MTMRSKPCRARFLWCAVLAALLLSGPGCSCDRDGGGSTTEVGTFEGLFDDVATGFNFPR